MILKSDATWHPPPWGLPPSNAAKINDTDHRPCHPIRLHLTVEPGQIPKQLVRMCNHFSKDPCKSRYETGFNRGGGMYLQLGGQASGVAYARCRRQCIEACSADQSTRSTEKSLRLHFSVIRMGSHGTFVLCTARSRCMRIDAAPDQQLDSRTSQG